ncbi:MAG: MBL fold metallo-hydrolase [Myxococcota bacterium]
MEWTYLGHASWRLRTAQLGVLFDPLLNLSYHAGTFEVTPRRDFTLKALHDDVVVVTHRHPDHFDVPSLYRLASSNPDRLLLTADALVAETARSLGFRWVRQLPDLHVLELSDVQMLTTPSLVDVVEWGMMVAHAEGTVFLQVDTELGPVERVSERLGAWCSRLGATGVDVHLARFNPLLQAKVATGGALGFPRRAYAKELGTAIAVGAPLVVPSACGSQHRGANAWLNHRDYPVSAQRFLRDLSHLSPEQQGWIPRVGETWRLEGHTRHEVGAADWVTISDASDERSFEHLEVPRMVDPSPTVTAAQLRMPIKRWVEQVLQPALPRDGLRRELEVVLPGGDRWFWCLEQSGVSEHRCPDAELRVQVAGSVLVDVIERRAPWGRALLGGWLRGLDARLPGAPACAPLFVYEALSYAKSHEQWVQWQVETCKAEGAG